MALAQAEARTEDVGPIVRQFPPPKNGRFHRVAVIGGYRDMLQSVSRNLRKVGIVVAQHYDANRSRGFDAPINRGVDFALLLVDFIGHWKIDLAVEQCKRAGVPVIRSASKWSLMYSTLREHGVGAYFRPADTHSHGDAREETLQAIDRAIEASRAVLKLQGVDAEPATTEAPPVEAPPPEPTAAPPPSDLAPPATPPPPLINADTGEASTMAKETKLRAVRRTLNIPVETLAKKVGINRTTLWKIDGGTANTTADRWAKIAEALGVSVPEIMDGPPSPGRGGTIKLAQDALRKKREAMRQEKQANAHSNATPAAPAAATLSPSVGLMERIRWMMDALDRRLVDEETARIIMSRWPA